MSYPESMLASIKKVEETRKKRLEERIPLLSPEEKDKLLHGFHPDYNPKGKRPVRVGPNQGDQMPNELVDLLEAYPRIDPDRFDLSSFDYDVDVLVIGGGGAGAAAALLAQENGANVLLVTKLRLGDANTMMAQGGIQAADKPHDSPVIHYLDVVGGGHYYNVPELVRALVMDAPKVIRWHEELGVMYDKEPDGTMITIHGGGTSKKRMHAARDYTGAEIMRTLRDEVRNRKIPYLEFSPVVELLLDDQKRCGGAIIYNLDTKEYFKIRAKAVIIATGGFGRLHIQGFPTTNHYGATADGLVLAYRVGCKLLYMDAVQYHPTGVAYPEQIVGLLITEKVRGLGAQLVNREGNQFIYPLETRDVVASGIIRECTERNLGVETPTGMKGVWLDSPMIEIINGPGTIQRMLPAMYRQFHNFGIDMAKLPILTYPTLHYQNGGIVINEWGETTVPGLFVAGEASGGVHGRNRLMGNSLLDVNVFGRRAGMRAAEYAKKNKVGKLSLDHVKRYSEELKAAGIERKRVAPMLLPDYRRPEVLRKLEGTYGLGIE
ncbi:succinate dehydrogenase/fumarate reductase flavoprotein subunit [candidate division WOR-3 bacterium]|uniref:Succinate dehydrogenase/fumarate reductase flavoprotein subunit n=1 Tax=candidate division WOR-3 bacterium TaxID=2052148 RepID=A0A660SDP3_UNCW3|nr:MAG: succinate dehydrogenase/fumarate reductase flavoprotein subunit [candidate division WOR-3 bacterium]